MKLAWIMIFVVVVVFETVLYLANEYTWNAISAIQPVQQHDPSKHQEQESYENGFYSYFAMAQPFSLHSELDNLVLASAQLGDFEMTTQANS